MDSSLSGSVVHGIFQARILEWAAISFSISSLSSLEREGEILKRNVTQTCACGKTRQWGAAEGEEPGDPDTVGEEWKWGTGDYYEELNEYLGKAGRDLENVEIHKNV